jgi:hypothetical protein
MLENCQLVTYNGSYKSGYLRDLLLEDERRCSLDKLIPAEINVLYKSVGYANPPFQVSDRSYGVQCIQEIFTYSKDSNKH